MKLIFFTLIPLILSIGIIPAISLDVNAESIEISSPRKQMQDGIAAKDVICKSGLTLMIRSTGVAACVTPTTAEKLVNAGWGIIEQDATMKEITNDLDESFSLSPTELDQQMTLDPNLIVIDMRDPNSYMNGYIEGSAVDVMEGATLDKRIKTMFSRIPEVVDVTHVVLVDDSESKALESAQIMNDAGIKASYLIGGIESWDNDLSTKMTPTTTSSEKLYQQLQNQDDVYLLDVREPSELEVTMISGSKNIPLADIFIEENLSEIPTDKPVVVICGSGNRATIATYELAQHGIDYQVLDGGIIAWDKYLEENNLS